MKSYKELIVWQKSIELVKQIYNLAKQLPSDERYNLSLQTRRAATSIPSNIAEGYSRRNIKEYRQFLRISYGSATELETQLIIIKEVYKNIDIRKTELLLEEILKILNVITRKLLDPKP